MTSMADSAAHQFPHASPVAVALIQAHRVGYVSRHRREIARRHGMGTAVRRAAWRVLRYASEADWSGPNEEKLLDVNARCSRSTFRPSKRSNLAGYAERVEDILRYLQTWLADPVDGGWAGSQRADAVHMRATAATMVLRRHQSTGRSIQIGTPR